MLRAELSEFGTGSAPLAGEVKEALMEKVTMSSALKGR